MKQRTAMRWVRWNVLLLVFLVGFVAPSADAGVLQYIPISNDGDSQIDSSKTYTHALDFGTGSPAATINGVNFTQGVVGSFPANFSFARFSGTGTPSTHGGNGNHNTSGNLANLMTDMVYTGSNSAGAVTRATVSGLIPGVRYDTRVYTRAWSGSASNSREATLSFDTDGIAGAEDSVTIYEDNATQTPPGFATFNQAYALSYSYTAETDRLQIDFAQPNFNNSWHLYGLTNEFTSSTATMTAKITGDDSYQLYVSGDPNQAGLLVGAASGWETPETYSLELPVDQKLYLHIVGNNGFSNGGDWAGVLAQFDFILPDGYYLAGDPAATLITTGPDWVGNATGFGDPSVPVTTNGPYPVSPWGSTPGAFDASAYWIWNGPMLPPGSSPAYLTYEFTITTPEPSSVAMLAGLSAIGLVGYLRRRRRTRRV